MYSCLRESVLRDLPIQFDQSSRSMELNYKQMYNFQVTLTVNRIIYAFENTPEYGGTYFILAAFGCYSVLMVGWAFEEGRVNRGQDASTQLMIIMTKTNPLTQVCTFEKHCQIKIKQKDSLHL